MTNHGFVRVAAATPSLRVADCAFNTQQIKTCIEEAIIKKVSAIVFPELSITAYTCADLFQQQLLLEQVEQSLVALTAYLQHKPILVVVGMPLVVNTKLYNVAAVLLEGLILGFVPKTYLPNYNEFQEQRWFTSASELSVSSIRYAGQEVPIGSDLLFETPAFQFGIELCEDLWTAIPPSSLLCLHGAEVIFNLSASNETVGKHQYRKTLVAQQSARCLGAYVYASAGGDESTTDLVFAGASLIAENGAIIAEEERFGVGNRLLIADIDIARLQSDRLRNTSFTTNKLGPLSHTAYRLLQVPLVPVALDTLHRVIPQKPFVPSNNATLNESCSDIGRMQVTGLAKRLTHTHCQTVVIGISGGLDSTLALLVAVATFDKLAIPRQQIIGLTMPGFGTTSRTYTNALALMQLLGVSCKEISIIDAVNQHLKDIGHSATTYNTTYENAQARERTQILMDYANKVNGLVVGTGDLSELALGWCTYNGDHISMYAVNAGVPKTLVATLVAWIGNTQLDAAANAILVDVLDTPISPELLPASAEGSISQLTEDVVGPYLLHDFFLYYLLRFGFSPAKIYFLAQQAFSDTYSNETILKWLAVFFRRFFAQQFKRSCMPDGPKVGSVNLSPRGDWRMPSDASAAMWLKQIEELG